MTYYEKTKKTVDSMKIYYKKMERIESTKLIGDMSRDKNQKNC